MRVLVTGGTGFIGSAVVRRLRARGDEVVVLARRPGSGAAAALAATGAKIVAGDLLETGACRAAVDGCGAVVHCAGRPGPATRSLLTRLHVDATRSVIEAARAGGVRRVVNIASQAVLFGGEDLINASDATPYPARYIDPYSETKAAGERLALAASGIGGLEVLSLRPAVVWGRGDRTVLPIMLKLARGLGIPACGPGTNIEATTHIENLADAVLLALDGPGGTGGAGVAGKAYLVLDGFRVTWREFLGRTVEAAGVRAKFMTVPRAVAEPAAWALDRVAGGLGLPVPLAYFGVRTALTSREFNATGARDELGYVPRVGWEDGLADLGRWVESVGGWRGVVKAAK